MYNKTPRADRKFNKSRDWLYEEYVIKNRSLKEVASDCGLTSAGLKNALTKYGITKPKIKISVSELAQYLEEGKTVDEVCEIYGCSRNVIYRLMKTNNLTTHYKPDHSQYDNMNDALICSLYFDGFSPESIAKEIGISRTSVKNHLKHCGIPLRTMTEAQFNYRNKDFPEDLKDYDKVYDLYINQKLSKKDLGLKYNVDPGTIDKVLKDFKIQVRTNAESKIGLMTGESHPNWQGGITHLDARLRTIFQHRIEPLARERDNCTCQMCGSKDNIHVHHITSFSDIVKEILSEHQNLDPQIDTEELITIITNDDRFTSLDNLICVCKECHLYKIHGFKRQ